MTVNYFPMFNDLTLYSATMAILSKLQIEHNLAFFDTELINLLSTFHLV